MQTQPPVTPQQSDQSPCPCGSGLPLAICCGPYIEGLAAAATAEALMRSRYTAFATRRFSYLQQTVSLNLREQFDPEMLDHETQKTTWTNLDIQKVREGICTDTAGEVTYTATFMRGGKTGVIRERSVFAKHHGEWKYTGGTQLTDPGATRQQGPKPKRNAPCPCGSGKKYKKCCGK